ncbi:MAG: electron transfer flavoprotein subunit beta/FixA family protein [bacterium]
MKIAVLIKRVPDTASVIKIGPDNKSIVEDNLKYVMSPYDEHAVEQAIRIKEAGEAEVVIVSCGGEEVKETIRAGLAMEADYGILVKDEALKNASGKGAAIALAAALKTVNPDIIFAGKQAVDDDGSQVGERVAEILDIPHVSAITGFALQGDKAGVKREIEGGTVELEVGLPALFTAQKGLNTPRYPKLPNIIKAKKKEIKEMALSDLSISADDISSGMEVLGMEPPKERGGGKILEGDKDRVASELVKILHEQEKVI